MRLLLPLALLSATATAADVAMPALRADLLRWEPHPLRAPGEVDARRAGMQLPPLADYRAMASERICAGFGEQGLE